MNQEIARRLQVLIDAASPRRAAKAFDESLHPRYPEGTAVDTGTGAGGGRFSPSDGNTGAPSNDLEALRDEAKRAAKDLDQRIWEAARDGEDTSALTAKRRSLSATLANLTRKIKKAPPPEVPPVSPAILPEPPPVASGPVDPRIKPPNEKDIEIEMRLIIGVRPSTVADERSGNDVALPFHWPIYNAPRPLMGTVTWKGDFITGVFYAAVDPADPYAASMTKENSRNDARRVVHMAEGDMYTLGRRLILTKYPVQGLEVVDKPEHRRYVTEAAMDYMNRGEEFYL